MALAADDHVVVHGDPEVAPGLDDPLRDLDVGAARLGVAARVVVDEDQRRGAEVEAAAAAYQAAELRQGALMNRNDPNDVAAREELIQILRWYGQTLGRSQNSHETVLGLFLEDVWREYSQL